MLNEEAVSIRLAALISGDVKRPHGCVSLEERPLRAAIKRICLLAG
jgi:hypothetical protein